MNKSLYVTEGQSYLIELPFSYTPTVQGKLKNNTVAMLVLAKLKVLFTQF